MFVESWYLSGISVVKTSPEIFIVDFYSFKPSVTFDTETSHLIWFLYATLVSQPVFTCLKLKIGTLEQGLKYIQSQQ